MKKFFWLTIATLATLSLGSSLAFSQLVPKHEDNLFLETGGHWTRSDWYGTDKNHNGRIDDSEWTETRTSGLGKAPRGANKARPLKAGETHRWSTSWEGNRVEEESSIEKASR